MIITKICPQCHKEFTTTNRNQKLCSRQCAFDAMSRKVELTCPTCGKVVYVHKGTKFCCKKCADEGRRGVRLAPVLIKTCPVCNKEFESKWKDQKFCSRKCAAKGYRTSKYNLTEEGMIAKRNLLKKQWQDPDFRQAVVDRMKTRNPVHMPGVVEKASATRRKNNSYRNNFKYGNGWISPYEQAVKNKLEPLGFVYNYPIVTRFARDLDPEAHYAHAYKPDFVNLDTKLCIEIDGYGHSSTKEKETDTKKEKCLHILGYKVIRFTHEDIKKGVFDEWLSSYQKSI